MAHPSSCTRAPGDGAIDESACRLRGMLLTSQCLRSQRDRWDQPAKGNFRASLAPQSKAATSPASSLQLQAALSIFPPVPISRRVRSGTCTRLRSAVRGQADVRMTDQPRERMAADGRSLPHANRVGSADRIRRNRQQATRSATRFVRKRTPIERV